MQKILSVYLPALVLVVFFAAVWLYPEPVRYLSEQLNESGMVGYTAFVALLVVATVVAPITVMPLIPMASMTFGPLVTGVLSVIGWTVGAVIAFLIARYLGRPAVERFVSFERLDSFMEQFHVHTRFLGMVVLRLTIPVDVVSYALGFTRAVGLFEYTAATLIGVVWFSFAFAYLGNALIEQNTPLFLGLGAVSLLIFTTAWYMLRRLK